MSMSTLVLNNHFLKWLKSLYYAITVPTAVQINSRNGAVYIVQYVFFKYYWPINDKSALV